MPYVDLPPPTNCVHRLERGVARPPGAETLTSTRHPLKVHFNEPEDEALAVAVLEATEVAWDVQVDEIGFRAPVPDGIDGPEIDLYLVDSLSPYNAYTASDLWADTVPGDGFNGTPAYAVFSSDLPLEAVDLYTSHEFAHLTQWATDYGEPSLSLWEGTATAAQTWTHGTAVGAWDADVPSFQRFPGAPLLLADGYQLAPIAPESYFEYGAALWVWTVDQLHGGHGQGARLLWEATANEGDQNEPDVVDALAAVGPGDLAAALDHIAVARALVGPDWSAVGLAEAETWGPAWAIEMEDLPSPWEPEHLYITGQAFVRHTVEQDGVLTFTVDSSHTLSVQFLIFRDELEVHRGRSAPVEVGDVVIVTLSNLGPEGWDGDDDPWVAADPTLTWSITDAVRLEPESESPKGSCGCATSPPSAPWFTWLKRRSRWAVEES